MVSVTVCVVLEPRALEVALRVQHGRRNAGCVESVDVPIHDAHSTRRFVKIGRQVVDRAGSRTRIEGESG